MVVRRLRRGRFMLLISSCHYNSSRFCCCSSGGGRRDRRASASTADVVARRSARADDPGRSFAGLAGRQGAVGDQAADGGRADGQGGRRVVERDLAALGAFSRHDGWRCRTVGAGSRYAPRVQLLPWLVDLPGRLSTAAIVSSGIWRARARTSSTISLVGAPVASGQRGSSSPSDAYDRRLASE